MTRPASTPHTDIHPAHAPSSHDLEPIGAILRRVVQNIEAPTAAQDAEESR